MRKTKIIPKTKVIDREQLPLNLAKGKDVLHIGMGGFVDDDKRTSEYVRCDLSTTVHGQLSKVAKTLTGIDINPKTIEAMQSQIPGKYICGDISQENLHLNIDDRYDIILFLEVIEHLDNFSTALTNLRHLLKPGGKLVISTANAYCLDSILKLAFRYESCHEEHTSYFSYLTLKRLLEMNNFQIQDFLFTLQMRRKYGSIPEWIGFQIMHAVSKLMPQYAQGIIVVATPDASNETLKLTTKANNAAVGLPV